MRFTPFAPLGVLLVLLLPACSDTPTEPATSSPARIISLTVDVRAIPGDTGNLNLSAGVCSCTSSSLSVFVNGAQVGSMPCSSTQDFPLPRTEAGTTHCEIRVTDDVGTSGSRSFDLTSSSPGALSLTVRAVCP